MPKKGRSRCVGWTEGYPGGMDEETKKKLTIIGAVSVAIIVLYFLISPYQNCMCGGNEQDHSRSSFCSRNTAW